MPRVEERGLARCVMIGYGLARHLFLVSMPPVCVLNPNTLIPTAKQEALWAARAKRRNATKPRFGHCAEPWFVSTHAQITYNRCSADGAKSTAAGAAWIRARRRVHERETQTTPIVRIWVVRMDNVYRVSLELPLL